MSPRRGCRGEAQNGCRDRLLVTLVSLLHGMTHDVLACWFGVYRSTVTRAIDEVRPLLAERGRTVSPKNPPEWYEEMHERQCRAGFLRRIRVEHAIGLPQELAGSCAPTQSTRGHERHRSSRRRPALSPSDRHDAPQYAEVNTEVNPRPPTRPRSRRTNSLIGGLSHAPDSTRFVEFADRDRSSASLK